MDRSIGSILGIAGGAVAVAGFLLPWVSLTVNLAPLRDALGPLASAAEGFLAGSLPPSVSITGLDVITGGIQGLLSLGGQAPRGGASADLGSATAIVTLVIGVVALTLVLAILTAVASVVNLLKGRLRAGMIGFGAATLALSLVIFVVLRMLLGFINQFIQQQAASLGGGAAAGLAGSLDIGQLVSQVFALSTGPGIYLCVVGGVLGVAGGIMGRKREKKEPAPAEAPAAAPAAEPPK